jgi:hypothetical protein
LLLLLLHCAALLGVQFLLPISIPLWNVEHQSISEIVSIHNLANMIPPAAAPAACAATAATMTADGLLKLLHVHQTLVNCSHIFNFFVGLFVSMMLQKETQLA